MRECGGDPVPLFLELGLDETIWEDPDTLIPVMVYCRALNLAAEQTGEPHFGLLLSQRQSLQKFGTIGYLLKQEGVNFKDVLQEIRSALARTYLADTNMPISTISTILSFAETAVFSRAFKRDTGMAPREWRNKNKVATV